jgi:hypothetical protein
LGTGAGGSRLGRSGSYRQGKQKVKGFFHGMVV